MEKKIQSIVTLMINNHHGHLLLLTKPFCKKVYCVQADMFILFHTYKWLIDKLR